jgi:hypothetical protein
MAQDVDRLDLEAGLSVGLLGTRGTPDRPTLPTQWSLSNRSNESIEILEFWFPHDQFHRERERLQAPRRIRNGESLELAADVTFGAKPGEVVENAFLILRMRFRDRDWRVFVRLRIDADGDGQPNIQVERVSAQRVGVSGGAQAGLPAPHRGENLAEG